MALNEERLKAKIKSILDTEAEWEESPEQSRVRFSAQLSKAIVEEIKEAKINYISGLIAPTGAVTGAFEGKLS